MSLIKLIRQMQETLLDVKLDIQNENLIIALKKIDDVLDNLSEMKQNRIVLRGSVEADPVINKFRKFPGLVG
jgi:hypothetical protein